MLVIDILSRNVPLLPPETPLSQGLETMRQQGYSCLLVGHGRQLAGIVTERDIVRLCQRSLKAGACLDVPLSNIMTTELVYVSEDTPLTEALAIARHRSIRHIPVLDEQRQCIGVVTQRDIMNAYISLVETQVKLVEQNRTLEGLSLEDALMGIGNRRAMEADLVFSQEMAKRYSTPYAVALLDLDFFKRYNDALGHQAGDFALQATAQVLKTCKRETDRIYRYGGEEILVLMRGTTLPDAELAAQRFCQAIQKLALPHPDSPYQVLTASVGVASGQGDDWQTLVAHADRALYRAKEGGRNRVVSAAVV